MNVLTYSDVRANLKNVMDRVVDDRVPVIITRRKAEPVVMVALSEWRAMDETTHLLSSPANAAELQASIAEFDAGLGEEHELIGE